MNLSINKDDYLNIKSIYMDRSDIRRIIYIKIETGTDKEEIIEIKEKDKMIIGILDF
jgi:hypothetical protein